MVSSQTGSGKTAAFMLPALHKLVSAEVVSYDNAKTPNQERQSARSRGDRPRFVAAKPKMLVLTPTRELALQVTTATDKYSAYSRRIKAVSILGGMPYPKQMQLLSRNPEILVATPGRLIDHMESGKIDFSELQMLVLDEADRMLDMGFIHDIRRVLNILPQKKQSLLFSATFSDDIKALAERLLNSPRVIEVARRNATADTVAQKVHPVDRDRKKDLLSHLILSQDWHQVLVFTRMKHGANRLVEYLDKQGITAMAIHGNKSQSARTRALADFKTGDLRVLVATDIAARGIDIDQLPHVVNYELPNVPEDYVHRIGRTGRAGAEGEAVSLVCVDEEGFLASIEKLIKRQIPREVVSGFAPDPNARPEPIQLGRRVLHGGAGGSRSGGGGGGNRGGSSGQGSGSRGGHGGNGGGHGGGQGGGGRHHASRQGAGARQEAGDGGAAVMVRRRRSA